MKKQCIQCAVKYTSKWYRHGTQCRKCYRKSVYNYKGQPYSHKLCKECGDAFNDSTFGQNKLYCSVSCGNSCKYVAKEYRAICLQCNESFHSNIMKSFCNNKCYKRFYKKNTSLTVTERLKKNLRSRLNQCLKNSSDASATRLSGCSIAHLKKHLESQFQPGMTWDNYGRSGWHIDHIEPLSKFNLNDLEQLKKVCHYSNLQPLWAKDNLKKGNKYV